MALERNKMNPRRS